MTKPTIQQGTFYRMTSDGKEPQDGYIIGRIGLFSYEGWDYEIPPYQRHPNYWRLTDLESGLAIPTSYASWAVARDLAIELNTVEWGEPYLEVQRVCQKYRRIQAAIDLMVAHEADLDAPTLPTGIIEEADQ